MEEVRTWDEFRDTGLLWLINRNLHTFGWSIAVSYDENEVEAVPMRVGFRGFTEDIEREGYEKLAKYMAEHSDEILNEMTGTCCDG